jgi:hypothetical protein
MSIVKINQFWRYNPYKKLAISSSKIIDIVPTNNEKYLAILPNLGAGIPNISLNPDLTISFPDIWSFVGLACYKCGAFCDQQCKK